MLYHGYDNYGYNEPVEFKTMAEQKKTEFPPVKKTDNTHSHNSFHCECGQETGDLVEPII